MRQIGDRESERFLVSLDAWERADFVSAKGFSSLVDREILQPIGSGSYNRTYRTASSITINGYHGIWVVKCPINDHPLSKNKRATRKWNEIHTKPEERAYLLTGGRWLAPYRGRTLAPDQAVQTALLKIYLKTRQVVRDGSGEGNFLWDNDEREAYLVDVDQTRKR